jgi:hypothetical protein
LKIEQLFVQYLYNKKQVALQGIGIFRLRPDVALPADGDKDFLMPADAFSFEYNLKTTEDEALVDYIVQHTRKIKPLASADLDSYAIFAKQFLNLGKPFLIEGVGTLQKNQQGNYEFIAGQFITPKIDDFPKQLREKRDESVSFESERSTNNSGRNLMIVLISAIIILGGLALYYFLVLKKSSNNAEQVEPTAIIQDTLKKDTLTTSVLKPDSTNKNGTDSINTIATPTPQAIKTDSSNFKVVLKEYSTQEAIQKAYNRLTNYGHKLVIIKIDSARYKLAIPFTRPLADTLRVKDSLKKFFGGKPYIQL